MADEGRELRDEKDLESGLEIAGGAFMNKATRDLQSLLAARGITLTDEVRASVDACVNGLVSSFVTLAGELARASDITRKRVENTLHEYERPKYRPDKIWPRREGDE